jgi:hypothetical protein
METAGVNVAVAANDRDPAIPRQSLKLFDFESPEEFEFFQAADELRLLGRQKSAHANASLDYIYILSQTKTAQKNRLSL